MDGKARRVRVLPFLAGAALGSLLGVLAGAVISATLGHEIESWTEETIDRLFGRRDEELRFELLLQ